MEIVIKIGTHSLQCVQVCRKRKLPVIGDVISVKYNHFDKEKKVRITEVPQYPARCYFGELI